MAKKGLNDEIARVAYELYQQSGCVQGYDQEHWCEAERIVLARQAADLMRVAKTVKPAKPVRKEKKAGKTTVKKTSVKGTPQTATKGGVKRS
jgi:hypothetical protein